MELRGIEFGNVLGASGVQGFFGEGYWFHGPAHLVGMNLDRITFVAKTATASFHAGNMRLTPQYTPKKYFPDCVKVQISEGVMLNSVGLSNPGIIELLRQKKWQKRTRPFFLSIMSLADTVPKRREELRSMLAAIAFDRPDFVADFGVQINLSCPNTGHNPRTLIEESVPILDMASMFEFPIMLKYSIATAPIKAVMELNKHPHCDAICVSNTVPYGWRGIGPGLWKSEVSPLSTRGYGDGGISGPVLRPLVCEWIARLRDAGFTKPINGGGGIFSRADVDAYHEAGASSIFIGSVATLRPWRVRGIVNYTNTKEWG